MLSIPLVVVEGLTDAPVVERLLASVDLEPARLVSRGGKTRLDPEIETKYNKIARFEPVLVLRDLDHDAPCAAQLVTRLVANPERFLVLRIAVRATEAWLMADAAQLARFLHVPPAQIPHEPDRLTQPKRALVELARQSTKPEVRALMVPEEGAVGVTGPGYATKMIEFAQGPWRPEIARQHSDSLHRCLLALEKVADYLAGTGSWPSPAVVPPVASKVTKPAKASRRRR